MTQNTYWQEAFEVALDSLGLYSIVESLKPEQREEIGKSLASSHENYGLAFYTPPPSDRISEIEREWKSRLARQEREAEKYLADTKEQHSRRVRDLQDTIDRLRDSLRGIMR